VDAFFNSVASGLILGSLYATMAIGLTIIYGVSHVFNFAHGHVAVIAAYITWYLMVQQGGSLGVGIAASLAFMVVFGWLLYQLPIRHLLRRKEWAFATLLFTLGLAIFPCSSRGACGSGSGG
jgi:branched-chain amino acid transport system permease protein